IRIDRNRFWADASTAALNRAEGFHPPQVSQWRIAGGAHRVRRPRSGNRLRARVASDDLVLVGNVVGSACIIVLVPARCTKGGPGAGAGEAALNVVAHRSKERRRSGPIEAHYRRRAITSGDWIDHLTEGGWLHARVARKRLHIGFDVGIGPEDRIHK